MQSEKNKILRIAQITDSHLFADSSQKLNGLDTLNSLQQVMQAVLDSQPELIIFSGDLVDRPEAAAYFAVKSVLDLSTVPVFCLPGNHDDPDLLKETLSSEKIHNDFSTLVNNWQLLFLNSYQPNTHAGKLGDNQLQMLDRHLRKHSEYSALICLHHPPVPIHSSWMDAMGLEQSEELFAVVDRHPQVKAVIWGHIHQQFNQTRNGVKLLGTPSTCVQFMPGASQFCLDNKPPGYRWLELYENGAITTEVIYLPDFDCPGNGLA